MTEHKVPLPSSPQENELAAELARYAAGKNRALAKELYKTILFIARRLSLMIASLERAHFYKICGIRKDNKVKSTAFDCTLEFRKHLAALQEACQPFAERISVEKLSDKSAAILGCIFNTIVTEPIIQLMENVKEKIYELPDEGYEDTDLCPDLQALKELRNTIWLGIYVAECILNISMDPESYRSAPSANGGRLPDVNIWPLLSMTLTRGVSIDDLAAQLVKRDLDYNRSGSRSQRRRVRNEKDRLQDALEVWLQRFSDFSTRKNS